MGDSTGFGKRLGLSNLSVQDWKDNERRFEIEGALKLDESLSLLGGVGYHGFRGKNPRAPVDWQGSGTNWHIGGVLGAPGGPQVTARYGKGKKGVDITMPEEWGGGHSETSRQRNIGAQANIPMGKIMGAPVNFGLSKNWTRNRRQSPWDRSNESTTNAGFSARIGGLNLNIGNIFGKGPTNYSARFSTAF